MYRVPSAAPDPWEALVAWAVGAEPFADVPPIEKVVGPPQQFGDSELSFF